MATVADILKFVETLAPRSMKMDWDNVGLNVGRRDKDVKKILVSLDPFTHVCQEALDIGADLLVTHHVLIFRPGFVTDSLAEALPALDRKLRGFAAPDALMVGVETRSSSPVRLLRDKSFQSNIRGLYPCGEGAGYAGGIVSAAVDGIRVAEAVAAPIQG